MAAKAKLSLDPVADLKRRLVRRPKLRTAVHAWWRDHELGDHPAVVGKRIALALIEEQHVDAALIVLHELLADHLRAADLAALLARLFEAGHLREPSVVDGFGVRVLGTLLHRVRGRAEVARSLAQWRHAPRITVWQRRAACVAFTELAPQGDAALPDLAQLIVAMCTTIVWSHERFDQTAVGWLLRELSRAEPILVDNGIRRTIRARLMSRECARLAVERLAPPRRKELLAHHRRATTLK